MLHFLASLPVPRDLPLPLPLPETVLKVLLVLFFLVHILFVNLTVGGSLLVSIFERLGFRSKRFDDLAHEIAATVTVNKSLAVVMGIGPLLCINLVYTTQWYSANSLTGHAWLMIIPLVTVAFLLAYLHKYTWDSWNDGKRKSAHWLVGVAAALLFLAIPFIFLANVNLMLFPDQWSKVKGFFSSLSVGNVLPRYIHFMCASVALCGLAGSTWFWRHPVGGFLRGELRRIFYRIAGWATAAQFVAGPLLLFTLPAIGRTPNLYALILPSAALGLFLCLRLLAKAKGSEESLATGQFGLWLMFSVVVLGMGSGRHAYREACLATHKQAIRERSAAYEKALSDFTSGLDKISTKPKPDQLFVVCAACHMPDQRLVGPSLREIAGIYAGNPKGIVEWAKAPGKKRPDFPQMPPFGHLGEEALLDIANYLLQIAPK